MKKATIRMLLQIIFFLGLGLGLVYWRFTEMSLDNKNAMSSAFQNINWWVVYPIAVVGFLSHYFRALRWKILLQTVDLNPSVANTTMAVLIGYLVNTVVPRFGEIAKCTVLAKYENSAPDKAIGTIIGERAFDLITLIIVMLLFLIMERDVAFTLLNTYFGSYFHSEFGINWTLIFLASIVLIVGIIGIILIFKKLRNSKLASIVKSLGAGISSIWKLKQRLHFIVYTILIWLMYTLMAYLGYFALEGTMGLSFSSALGIIAFGSIGMIVTPGGIGTYPIIVAGVLLLFGIQEGVGMAYGWISWAAQTAIVIILGLLSLLLLPLINGKRTTIQTSTAQE